eukprot:m.180126 g.180126  ORF g.180126 m.180126 type:complete len:688 (-) comp14943_c0_seq3:5964-8027(-)
MSGGGGGVRVAPSSHQQQPARRPSSTRLPPLDGSSGPLSPSLLPNPGQLDATARHVHDLSTTWGTTDEFDPRRFAEEVEASLHKTHARAHESISQSVLRLIEHAGQVQAKVEVEMGTLQRSGGESARLLTKELREMQDRAVAAELTAQIRQRDVAMHQEVIGRLETQISELKEQVKVERRERTAAHANLSRLQNTAAEDMEAREAQHAAAIQQLVTTHAAAIEVLKRQRVEEMKQSATQLAETRSDLDTLETRLESMEKARDDVQRELTAELRKGTEAEKTHATEVSQLQEQLAAAHASIDRLEVLTRELSAQHVHAQETHRTQVDELRAEITREQTRGVAAEARVADLEAELKRELRKASDREREAATKVAGLKQDMADKLEALGCSLAEKHGGEVAELERRQEAELKRVTETAADAAKAAAREHKAEVTRLQQSRARELRELQERHAADAQRLTDMLAQADREHALEVRHHQDRLAAATAGHSADQRTHDEQLLIARNDTKRLEEKLDKAETEIRRLQADATDHIREAARQEQNALHALTDQKAVTSRAKENAEMVQFKLTAAEEQLAELKAKLAAVEEGRKGDMASGKEQCDALRAKLADKEAELSLQVRAARLAADDAQKDREESARRITELEKALREQRTTFEESATKYEGLIAQQEKEKGADKPKPQIDDAGKKTKKKKFW